MINSQGKQDLIVYLLGENQRYELQNYPNITIPTNIEVANEVRDDFATRGIAVYPSVERAAWALGRLATRR